MFVHIVFIRLILLLRRIKNYLSAWWFTGIYGHLETGMRKLGDEFDVWMPWQIFGRQLVTIIQ